MYGNVIHSMKNCNKNKNINNIIFDSQRIIFETSKDAGINAMSFYCFFEKKEGIIFSVVVELGMGIMFFFYILQYVDQDYNSG